MTRSPPQFFSTGGAAMALPALCPEALHRANLLAVIERLERNVETCAELGLGHTIRELRLRQSELTAGFEPETIARPRIGIHKGGL